MRTPELDTFIRDMLGAHPRISDLNFTIGRPCQIAADGTLHAVDTHIYGEKLNAYQTEQIALTLIEANRRLMRDLLRFGSCDFSYQLHNGPRFRTNIFRQKEGYSIVMRLLSNKVPTIEDLALPSCFKKMGKEKNGIVFFTGATGTGKTTSLAAILEEVNRQEPLHIVTLEDPIEYVHTHKVATFNQREFGRDFDSFAHGLRAALRQAPHVILVGEIRDRETVEIALNAAETGHLVFTTLHTMNAGYTINRLLGMFTTEEERQVRFRLADSLRWVVGQRLVPKVRGGRVAIFEIMQNNIRVKDSIVNGESEGKTFYEIIDAGRAYDMQTFDQHIARLFDQNVIDESTAMAYATSRARVRQSIDHIKSGKGERTSDIEGLTVEMDFEEDRSNFF